MLASFKSALDNADFDAAFVAATMWSSAGLDGLECWHTRHPKSTAKRYREMADRHGLIITGGSDCHGAGRGHPLIGTVRVPYEILEEMKRGLPSPNSQLN